MLSIAEARLRHPARLSRVAHQPAKLRSEEAIDSCIVREGTFMGERGRPM